MSGGAMSRRKGGRYELDVVTWLRANGLPHVERRLAGSPTDLGDITGWPGTVLEAKAHRELCLAPWMDQLRAAALRSAADVAALLVKRRGVADVGAHYVVMRADDWLQLMRQAGYAPAAEAEGDVA